LKRKSKKEQGEGGIDELQEIKSNEIMFSFIFLCFWHFSLEKKESSAKRISISRALLVIWYPKSVFCHQIDSEATKRNLKCVWQTDLSDPIHHLYAIFCHQRAGSR
jgi:hypothetical protein